MLGEGAAELGVLTCNMKPDRALFRAKSLVLTYHSLNIPSSSIFAPPTLFFRFLSSQKHDLARNSLIALDLVLHLSSTSLHA